MCLANPDLQEPSCSLLSSTQTLCLWSNEKAREDKRRVRQRRHNACFFFFFLHCVSFRLHMPLLLWRHGNRPHGPPWRGSFPSGWWPLTPLMTLNTWVTHTSVRSVSIHLAAAPSSFAFYLDCWKQRRRDVRLLSESNYISTKPLVTDESN